MTNEYFWIFLFTIFAYLIVTDSNLLQFIDLIFRYISIQYRKITWWIVHNPETFWAKYFMWKRAMKIAKELMNESEMERRSRITSNDSKTAE